MTAASEPVEQPDDQAVDDTAVEAVAASDDTGGGAGDDPDQQEDDPDSRETRHEAENQLLSEEEIEDLKDNPKALEKALNRSYTQRMQALGGVERLARALEDDPEGTLARLAAARGYELSKQA